MCFFTCTYFQAAASSRGILDPLSCYCFASAGKIWTGPRLDASRWQPKGLDKCWKTMNVKSLAEFGWTMSKFGRLAVMWPGRVHGLQRHRFALEKFITAEMKTNHVFLDGCAGGSKLAPRQHSLTAPWWISTVLRNLFPNKQVNVTLFDVLVLQDSMNQVMCWIRRAQIVVQKLDEFIGSATGCW